MEKVHAKQYTSKALKIEGLIEKTSKDCEETKLVQNTNGKAHFKESGKASNQDKVEYNISNWIEYKVSGRCPDRRAYHASFTYANSLYIHGGHDIREGAQDTLWRISLNTKQYEWEKVQTRGTNKPGKIAYHSLTLHSENRCLLVGGSNNGEDNSNIYELDLSTLEWKLMKSTKPDGLDSIDEHSACLCGDYIYIFGGNVHGFKSDKLFLYDFKLDKWRTKEFQNGPSARSSHSAVVKDNKMYVFGGKDFENNKLNDFWVFDTITGIWTEIPYNQEVDWPVSRSGHSTGVFKNFIIIFGGIHELIQELNDLHLYDIVNNRWSLVYDEVESPVNNKSNFSTFAQSLKPKSPK